MITEDFVSLEVAKLLKEKGFSEPVHYDYHYTISVPQFHKKAHNFNGEEYANCETEWFSAPTLQMAMKWLRLIHNILIVIDGNPSDSLLYINIYKKDPYYGGWVPAESDTSLVYTGETIYEKDFKEYEEACEAAIKYCLENLI